MLPACVLAVRIISQVSVVVRYQQRTERSQLVLQRLDVRDSVGPMKHSRTLEFIFNSELLLVLRNLLNTVIKIRNNLRRHEGLFLRKYGFFLWNVNCLNTKTVRAKCTHSYIYIYSDRLGFRPSFCMCDLMTSYMSWSSFYTYNRMTSYMFRPSFLCVAEWRTGCFGYHVRCMTEWPPTCFGHHFVCVECFWYFGNFTFYVFTLWVLPPWGWPRGWPKRVGGHCVYNSFNRLFFHFAVTVMVYNRLKHRLWIT